ncbi:MAG: family 20 glycosylhydrolase [Lentisphaeria bacterium]|nr:family 20 glycosylhydrolase [Lentisphaeria bacterium]
MEKRPGFLTFSDNAVHVIPEPAHLRYTGEMYIDLADFTLADTPDAEPVAEELRRLFGLSGKGPGRLLCGELADAPSPEAYSITVRKDEVRISSASRRGMLYAVETLKQLRAGTWLREMELEDAPAMAIRGYHTNLASMRQLDFPAVMRLIDELAKFKINVWLLEYNHCFPFAGHPALHGALTFTPEEIAAIEARCKDREIEIMPLLQCIGHNGHIGIHPEYQHLFEPGAKVVGDMQLCPLNPGSFELFKDLASQIMAAHPGGRYFHIGADEVRSLGNCPECAEFVRQHGKGKLYTDYINKACEWVVSQGRKPVIWDDMLSHFPDLVPQISRNAAIMYWDYWTTSDPSPFFIARPAALPQTADNSWKDHWDELDEPERTITRLYGELTDVDACLKNTPGMDQILPYLGDQTPKWFKAFPFFDFYKDLGFEVFAAPSAFGNTIDDLYGLPNLGRTCKNIRLFAEKCRKSKGAGLFTTSWYCFPPETLSIGIIETAQNSWCGRVMSPLDQEQELR